MSPEEREEHEEHVDPEEIARLAEGALPPDVAEPILVHLSRCRSCMAAYAEAVRYRAAWLAERSAFEPPRNVLAHARAVVGPAPPRVRAWPRRLLQVAVPAAAAVWLVVTLVGRPGQQRSDVEVRLPSAVAEKLAEQTRLDRDLFVPGATDRVRSTAAFRSTLPLPRELVDSLEAAYLRAPTGRLHERAGFSFASALVANGSTWADEIIDELLKSNPRDCACLSLAAQLEYPRRLELAEKRLRAALAAGCRDDLTRMNLAIVRKAQGDTAEANATFKAFEHRDDALGDRARQELKRANE